MKVLFTGIGSIAERHSRNLAAICAGEGIALQMDALRRSREPAQGISEIYCDASEVPDDYDIVFVTNPTTCHLNTLKRLNEKGKHFFVEKPAVIPDQTKEAAAFPFKQDALYYVAGPLKYSAVVRYVREHIDPADVYSVRSISSSYLPDWRPGRDYRETYSARRESGGGVSIDLIHEWDYLTDLFGFPQRVSCYKGRKSGLEIDSDDYAIYIAEYTDKIAEVHLDYFGRKPVRRLELITKHDTIVGDLVDNTIRFLSSGETIAFGEERDDYQIRELKAFLERIRGGETGHASFLNALRVLSLTQGVLEE